MDKEEYVRKAFSRNIGLLTEDDQKKLSNARVAVAGAGGVGGLHLLTLARLGIGKFNISDLDTFDIVNINRQFGALNSTFGKEKAYVLANMLKDINPYAEIKVFPEGISDGLNGRKNNLDDFLDGVDIYVDGIDFFMIDIRRLIFSKCREKRIYAITSAPLGFGATLQIFSPDGMSFDEYFGINDNMDRISKLAAFASGLAPRPYHIKYLDMSKVSLTKETGPAVSPACTLASSLVATEVVKIITGKGRVRSVPHYLQIDMMRDKYKAGYLMFGGRNPIKRLIMKMMIKKVGTVKS